MPADTSGGETGVDDDKLTIVLCELLAAAGVGEWPGPAAATEVGIFYGAIATTPDRGVGVTVYGGLDDVPTGLAVRFAQIRTRGAQGVRDGADRLAAQVFHAFQGLARTRGIAFVRRTTFTPLGADENTRQERVDNYQITLDNPEA